MVVVRGSIRVGRSPPQKYWGTPRTEHSEDGKRAAVEIGRIVKGYEKEHSFTI